jgi:hypothetical protein
LLKHDKVDRCVELVEAGFQMTDHARVWAPNSADVRTQRIVLAIRGAVADLIHGNGRLNKAQSFVRRGLAENDQDACLHALDALCYQKRNENSAAATAIGRARSLNQLKPDDNAAVLIQLFSQCA